MTLLTPLGLIGLLGVVALIIIYIIKPNFQQKFISSTFVWKLSLKYRKKKIPTSKLRNLLLILCQVLFLTICAFLLAKPNTVIMTQVNEQEVIAIIDSSASMRTSLNEETRFERALDKVNQLTDNIFRDNGILSIILAEERADFLVQRASVGERTLVEDKLLALEEDGACSYGEADIDGALILCEEVLKTNPSAKIYIYTDIGYGFVPEGVEVISVCENEEWNVGILDASVKQDNNYYTFMVDVAYYCEAEYDSVDKSNVAISLNITNANPNELGVGLTMRIDYTVSCERGIPKRVIFITEGNYNEIAEMVEESNDETTEYVILTDSTQWIYSYDAVYITLDARDDSFSEDNSFNIFNGQKEVVKIQYASGDGKSSPVANPFVIGVLNVLQAGLSSRLDVRITNVKTGTKPATEGFDFYIFEHIAPEEMPEDGVVVLLNPDKSPEGAGFRIEEERDLQGNGVELTGEMDHPILNLVNPDNINVSKFKVVSPDGTGEGEYETLVTCDTNPVIMVKNDPNSKVVLINFSLHYSNFVILKDFTIFMYNMMQYFFPATTSQFAYEVYENVTINARGEDLKVTYNNKPVNDTPFTEFPVQMPLNNPGNYVITQTIGLGDRTKELKQYLFVKVSSEESNIWKADQTLESPYNVAEERAFYEDWLPYLAAALVALLFLEWWLQSRDSM